jgi:hypothetical protein
LYPILLTGTNAFSLSGVSARRSRESEPIGQESLVPPI